MILNIGIYVPTNIIKYDFLTSALIKCFFKFNKKSNSIISIVKSKDFLVYFQFNKRYLPIIIVPNYRACLSISY